VPAADDFAEFEVIESPPREKVAAVAPVEHAFELVDEGPPVTDAEAALEPMDDDESDEQVEKPRRKKKRKHFEIAFLGTWRHTLYRVYQDDDVLLFLSAGDFDWNIIGADDGSTRFRYYGGVGVVDAILIGMLAGLADAHRKVTAARDRAKREKQLNAMSWEELRAEAASGQYCFRVNATNTKKASIEPPSSSFWTKSQMEKHVVGWLKFTHAPTGKWKMILFRKSDAKSAVRAFRAVLGEENVEVDL
jgi:hypothetical protein